jgi:MerR HTH family regulatory protein/GAF domain
VDARITTILQRTSDPVAIVRVTDGMVVDVNEAFSAVTGHPHDQLVGRPGRDLFVGLGPAERLVAAGAWQELGPLGEVLAGLLTGFRELRVGRLSTLVVEVEGEREAICALRDLRDPMPGERRLAARARVARVVQACGPPREAATSALRALGECMQWDFGALWRIDPGSQRLRCTAVWHAPGAGLEALEEASLETAMAPGEGLAGRTWLSANAVWAPDALSEHAFQWQRDGTGDPPVHGWFGFPIQVAGTVAGVVEYFDRKVRQPDEELMRMAEELGGLFGRLLDGGGGEAGPPDATVAGPAPTPTPSRRAHELPPETVSTALQDLVGAVAAILQVLGRQPAAGAQEGLPKLPDELPASIERLDRLLNGAEGPAEGGRAATSPPRLPTGLTLKAVSGRTGIPAATLRTWERRYGFMRPARSATGYRLYGEEDIARILQVKYLTEQGVRIGQAMATVIEASGSPHAAAQERGGDDLKA